MADEQIPAGWYPDPAGDTSKIRYWDGQTWTEQTQSAVNPELAAGAAPDAYSYSASAPPPAQPAQPQAQQPMPSTIGSAAPNPYAEGQPAIPSQPMSQPIYAPGQDTSPYVAVEPTKDRKGFAVASLVLGIVSLPCVCLAWVSVLPGLLAVIFGALGIKSSRRGMAIAGLIIGALGIIAGIALTIFALSYLQELMQDPTRYGLPADVFENYDF
jgi:hypothetical protein